MSPLDLKQGGLQSFILLYITTNILFFIYIQLLFLKVDIYV